MVRGVYISRSGSERMTLQKALERYLEEVTPTKKPTTQRSEKITAQHLIGFLGSRRYLSHTAQIRTRSVDKPVM
jgi:hypothetical protein